MKESLILGIESSCDESCVALVRNGREIVSNVIFSQIDLHKRYGGVVPEVASRSHLDMIDDVVDEAMSGYTWDDLDAVAVTCGPGLVGALLVGVSFGKALACAIHRPLVAVNHIEGHICANYLSGQGCFAPPCVCLIVSGGHTHLAYVREHGSYEILGKTRDDAAGEAFDKVARLLGLPYPGGVNLDKLATSGRSDSHRFPRAVIKDSLDFSFSGLKSAVASFVNKSENKDINKADIAASFQEAVVSVLTDNAVAACDAKDCNVLALAGGVAANSRLRAAMEERCRDRGITLYVPPVGLCTDNAAMIAAAGHYRFIKGEFADLRLNAYPGLALGEKV